MLKLPHRLLHGEEHRAAVGSGPDHALEHHHAGTAPDDEGVAGLGQHAPLHGVAHVEEIVDPVFAHRVGIHQALAKGRLGAHIFEVRRVVSGPAQLPVGARVNQPGTVCFVLTRDAGAT